MDALHRYIFLLRDHAIFIRSSLNDCTVRPRDSVIIIFSYGAVGKYQSQAFVKLRFREAV